MWHVLVTLALLVTLRLWDPFLVESTRLSYFDFLQRIQPTKQSEQIVLIDIDEASLEKFGQYPIPRDILADELLKLDNSILGINILLSEADRSGGDAALSDALFDMTAVLAIAPTNKTNTDFRPQAPGLATFGENAIDEFVRPYDGMLFARQELMESAYGFGLINSKQDSDGIIRQIPLINLFEGQMYPSFALDLLRVAAGDTTFQVKTDPLGIMFVRIPKFNNINTDLNGNVTVAYWNEFNRYSLTEIDKIPAGSIAILGATFEGSTVVSSPVGSMYPHDIQANLLKTMIDGVSIVRLPEFMFYELFAMVLLSIIILFMLSKLSIAISGAGIVVLSSSFMYFSVYMFENSQLQFDPTFLLLTLILVFAHGSFVRFYTEFKLKQQIKGQFGTYLSPDMVEMLQKDPSLMKLGGERKEMTFLFMDICGFTPISEHYKNNNDPEGLVHLINDYLNKMTNIIMANGGTIDKYMGDCIMAFWNAPIPCPNHAEMAVKSAMEIEDATKELQKHYEEMGLPTIRVGTGVNTGDCIVGNMGSESRFDYSVIGDAVNLAARLEATAARGDYIDFPTIYSSHTMDQLTTIESKEIGQIKVKGKDELITIYTFDK
jgi:adenylate cyclase